MKIIYLYSSKYSGSTLIAYLLGLHPQISTLGERRKYFQLVTDNNRNKLSCSCGKLYNECDYWVQNEKELFERFDSKFLNLDYSLFVQSKNSRISRNLIRLYEKLSVNKFGKYILKYTKLNTQIEINVALMQQILKRDKTDVFLDTSKYYRDLLFLPLNKELSFNCVHFVRDPRAQIASQIKHNKIDINKAIKNWKEDNFNKIIKIKKQVGNLMVVKYEDLCKNPNKILNTIINKSDLNEFDFEVFEDRDWKDVHLMGNVKFRNQKFDTIQEDLSWKEKLSTEQQNRIARELKDEMKIYGYE